MHPARPKGILEGSQGCHFHNMLCYLVTYGQSNIWSIIIQLGGHPLAHNDWGITWQDLSLSAHGLA